MGGVVKDLRSKAELDNLRSSGAPVILHFWATWCEASKHMDQVFSHLSTDFPSAQFLRVEAEEQPEISEEYSKLDGKKTDTLEGADASSLANKVSKIAGSINTGEAAAPASLGMAAGATILETVKALGKQNGSSQIMNRVKPVSRNSGIAESNGLSMALNSRLSSLINSSPVMLFMKGKPEEPKCGFSGKLVEILREENVNFESFDVLTDEEVRQGLKVYSNWSSYPQLYIKGELIGGSDIVLEMQKSGELKRVVVDKGICKETLKDRLRALVASKPVMLFMKGSPDEPRCGFSSKVVNALREEGISFGYFDILTDDEVRQGLKVFSNWPTFPQLYHKGELIGGCDIILEMKSSGELKSTLSE